MSTKPLSAITTRHKELAKSLQTAQLDAFVFNPGPSLKYLTSLEFHLSERPVVMFFVPEKPLCIVLPELETAKLTNLPYSVKAFPYGENPAEWSAVFQRAARTAGMAGSAKIGIEPRSMRMLEMDLLQQAMPTAKFTAADDAIAQLRMRKDETELAAMQEAANIAQDALLATLPNIKIGSVEREIAAELTMNLLRHGSDPNLPFFPIISTGPNGANPHASPSERKLAEGDLLVIDWGANVDGYFSDITRTFAIGKVEPELQTIAEVAHQANQAGHQAAGPGIPVSEVDHAARAVIEAAGYGEYFIHRTGHGLGLEAHEEPYIRGDSDMRLATNMTFTIEPGIYLPNRAGVRIEDDVYIDANGCQSFTDLPRELITLG